MFWPKFSSIGALFQYMFHLLSVNQVMGCSSTTQNQFWCMYVSMFMWSVTHRSCMHTWAEHGHGHVKPACASLWDLSVDCMCLCVCVCPRINHSDRTTHVLYRVVVSWEMSVTSRTHTHTPTLILQLGLLSPNKKKNKKIINYLNLFFRLGVF